MTVEEWHMPGSVKFHSLDTGEHSVMRRVIATISIMILDTAMK